MGFRRKLFLFSSPTKTRFLPFRVGYNVRGEFIQRAKENAFAHRAALIRGAHEAPHACDTVVILLP